VNDKDTLHSGRSKQNFRQSESEKKVNASLECADDVTEKRTVDILEKPCSEDIRLQSDVACKQETERMVKQGNDFIMNEHEKEIIRLQDKVLRLQEKICKLQQKVSTLQGVNL
jgi:hypothetical protein